MAMPAMLTYTPDEYLAIERAAAHRSEFLDGRIVAMSGGSRNHSLITAQLIRLLGNQLDGRPCEVHGSDMRVKVADQGLYTYPDVTAVCGQPQFEDAHGDTLLNPTVIFEVLSPTTEAYDRGEKFARYRRLPTLMDYVLVAQDRPRIERFTRDGDDWVLTAFDGLEATVALASVGCGVRLGDVYAKVRWGADD